MATNKSVLSTQSLDDLINTDEDNDLDDSISLDDESITVTSKVENSVYLTAFNLTNCQSWVDSTVELTPGLNVIRSKLNNQGKSVFFKVVKVACQPSKVTRKEREEVIRSGAESAEAFFLFSDGTSCKIEITPTNVFYVYLDVNENIETYVDYPPDVFIRNMRIILSPLTKEVCNILEIDSALLFVNSDVKSDASLVSKFLMDEDTEKLLDTVEFKLSAYKPLKSRVFDRLSNLKIRANNMEFVSIEEEELIIEVSEKLLSTLETLVDKQEVVENMDIPDKVDVDGYLFLCDILDKRIDLPVIDKPCYKEISLGEIGIRLSEDVDLINRVHLPIEPREVDRELCNIGIVLEKELSLVSCLEPLEQKDYRVLELKDVVDNILTRQEFDSLVIFDLERIQKIINLAEVFPSVIKCFNSITDLLKEESNLLQLEKEIVDLESKKEFILNTNRVVDCPIYGEIIYKNGECIKNVLTFKDSV